MKYSQTVNNTRLLLSFVVSLLCNLTMTANDYTDKVNFVNFSVEDGLSHYRTNTVYQDVNGWIWLSTSLSIERFDGYNFKKYAFYFNDTTQTNNVAAWQFFENSKQELFVCTENQGLGIYNCSTDRFEAYKINGKHVLEGLSPKYMIEDTEGVYWIGSKTGLHSVNPENGQIKHYLHNRDEKNSIANDYIRKVQLWRNHKLLLATQSGLDIFDIKTETFTHLGEQTPLLNEEIYDFYTMPSGELWIASSQHGIVIYNPDKATFRSFYPEPDYQRSHTIRVIHLDKHHNYWIGTRGGLYVFNSKLEMLHHYQHNVLEDNSLAHNSILNIYEDKKGDVWIGTRAGLSYYVQEKQNFPHYKPIPGDNRYLNNGELYCFWEDPDGNIWCGTESGGINILDPETGTFSYITTDSKTGLNSNCIKAIVPDNHGNVLIGTYMGGLNICNIKTGKITQLNQPGMNENQAPIDLVWDITNDQKGNIWLTTEKGLYHYNPKNRSYSCVNALNNYESLSWISVDSYNDLWIGYDSLLIYRPGEGIIKSFPVWPRYFLEDSHGKFWIATIDDGFYLFDKDTGIIKKYTQEDGLASNLTYCMEEDNLGNLWISTVNGLSCFNPSTETFTNYDKSDGLQGSQFSYGASYKTSNGQLIFGGVNGFNMFDPSRMYKNDYLPPVYITDFKIFNKSLRPGQTPKSILSKTISQTNTIEIPYKYNVLTIEFAALTYANSQKNVYSYQMEGFENKRNEHVHQRSATYTNLNPGTYTFKVTGGDPQGVINTKGDSLVIKILPPYYRTWWFITLSIIVIVAFIVVLFIQIVKRKNIKNALIFEREKTKKLHEIDMLKFKFFTNISHEIRTPLTLILSPLEKMLKTDIPKEQVKTNHAMMYKNAKHLLRLVNQLLDFRKLEAGKLKLEPKQGDMVKFTGDIVDSFQEMMDDKNIVYKFSSAQDQIISCFDPDKFEKIMHNLLSNAVKYTNPNGAISIFISVVIDEDGEFQEEGEKLIKIIVKDTGVGIHKKNLAHIFQRYYTGKNTNEQGGTGIGLAYTKELVDLHKGKIFAESNPGEGSVFTIYLPYLNELNKSDEKDSKELAIAGPATDEQTIEQLLSDNEKKILLIIEDNKDVRTFIKSNFEMDYLVLEAANGKEGLDIAVKTIPTVIITDVMMPVMDGKELCDKIKKDERTSHIPVILLSALSSKRSVMEGLANGADDYITKPFDIDLLQSKMNNLLAIRKQLREKYTQEMILQPSSVNILSPDERFLQKAMKTVEDNIDDSELDVEKFAREYGISRMQLYRKISALTNMTVKEFINDIRMKRAMQLLTENKLTVSDTAYNVGFNDVSYFGKCFKKRYGMSPTEYIKKNEAKG